MRALALILTVGMLVISSAVPAATPVHVWSQSFGGTNPDGLDDVFVDMNGNIVMTGLFGQTVNFGGGPMVATGGVDMYIAGYDASGAHRWSRQFEAMPSDVATDAAGNVVVVGFTTQAPDFGGGVLAPIGFTDLFVAKYDPNGVHLWSRRFGSASNHAQGWGVATDNTGNIVIIGTFSGTTSFGGAPLTSSAGDVVVAKYDPNGVHMWSRDFGGSTNNFGSGIAIDSSNNVVICGRFHGSVSFGGGTLTSVGGGDAYIAKYDANGVHVWSQRFGGAGTDHCMLLAIDAMGSILATGSFSVTANLGGGALTAAGPSDGFVAKYDAGGAHQWSHQFGSASVVADVSEAITIDASGSLLIGGRFEGAADFSGTVVTSAGGRDIFLAKYDTQGTLDWVQRFGSAQPEESASGLAVDPVGDIVAGGYFMATDFGGGPLTAVAFTDIFLVKFREQQPVPVLFTRFEATPVRGAVQVEWNLWSDEGLVSFALFRRAMDAPQQVTITSGDARATGAYTDTFVEPGRTYLYELEIRTTEGSVFRSPVATVTLAALQTSVGPNHPNPFNPETTIEYTVGERMPVTLEIVDVAGALVTRLEQGVRAAGTYRATWNGRDMMGRPVGSGVYFYRLSGAPEVAAGKMVLIK